MDVSIYIGEVFIICALLLHILEYIIFKKSIDNDKKQNKQQFLFHMEHWYYYFIAAIIFINVIFSIDPVLSLISIFHIASFSVFVYIFIKIYVSRGTKFLENIPLIVFISLILQCTIILFQVIDGTSVGLYFLNESKLALYMENVAKIHIFSNIYLRGYGTFLHPNILAAYAISFMLFIDYLRVSKLLHVEQFYGIAFFIAGITILLSGSKTGITLFIMLVLWLANKKFEMFHVEQMIKIISFTGIILFIGFISISNDAKQSFQTRINQFYVQNKDSTVKEFLFGSGIGTYRLSYDEPSREWWNYEPIHFVPFILLKELGVFISVIIALFILHIKTYVPHGTKSVIFPIVVFVGMILFVDHFAWDIYQGTAVLIIPISLMLLDKYNNIFSNNFLDRKIKNG